MAFDHFQWGITFLQTDSRLTEFDRERLMIEATNLYLDDVSCNDIECQDFEARVYTTGKYQMIGAFGGREFRAEVHHNKFGKMNLSFLVCERTKGHEHSYLCGN